MNAYEKQLKAQNFVLVYQGGHHNVYCDGKQHIKTTGGYVGWTVAPHPRWEPYPCDCAEWEQNVPRR